MSTTIQQHFDAQLLALASSLERVPFTSRKQIEELVRASQPAIFTGALEQWPARSKWSPEYFRARWGDRTLHAHETKWTGKTPYLFAQKEKASQKTIADFFDGTAKDDQYDLYVHQVDAAEIFPGSLDDLDFGSLIDSSSSAPRFRPNVWMGTPGTRSGLHFDSAENLVAMFHGRKGFVLMEPRFPKLLYPFRSNPTKSQIDPTRVDWQRFPRLKQAKIYIDSLHPGELLFLPRTWWHYFTSLEFAINSTCWFYWNGVSTNRTPYLDSARHIFRCGPSYPLQFLFQFMWHGMLGRPYERKALSPPPHGVRLWAQLRGRRKASEPEKAKT